MDKRVCVLYNLDLFGFGLLRGGGSIDGSSLLLERLVLVVGDTVKVDEQQQVGAK